MAAAAGLSRAELRAELDSIHTMYAEVYERFRQAIQALEQDPADVNAVQQFTNVEGQLRQLSGLITALTTRLRQMPGSRKYRKKSKKTRRSSRTRKHLDY